MKPMATAFLALTLLTNPIAAEAEDRQATSNPFLVYIAAIMIGSYYIRALSPEIPKGPGQVTLTNGKDILTAEEFEKLGFYELDSYECKLVSARYTYRFSGCRIQRLSLASATPVSSELIVMDYEAAFVSPN